MGKETEAQKRASRKYYLTHKKYYSIKSNEYQKRIRKLRDEYKQRINNTITYVRELKCTAPDERILDNIIKKLEGKNE